MIKTILWDIDGTLLDFKAAENNAVRGCFARFGLGACTDEMIARYSAINLKWWERLERGECTKPDILRGRFAEFFAAEGIVCDRLDELNALYQRLLGETIVFLDDGYEVVRRLRGRVKQYAVTNGTSAAQERKLERSGLGDLLDGAFISDKVGYEKPDVRFFDHVLAHIEPCERREIAIVGDSLTSDMRGGEKAGLVSVWYDPRGLPNTTGVRIDRVICDLREVEGLLAEL